MKKCPNCGALNHNEARFCVNCGHKLGETSSQSEQPKSEDEQPKQSQSPSREQYNNERNQANNVIHPTNHSNYKKDVHNLLSDVKNSINNTSNGQRPWFKSLAGVLAALIVLLIIIIIELGICIGNLSDIDNTVGASHNQDDDQSYVIQHHQHKMPKLYINHHINHHEAHV